MSRHAWETNLRQLCQRLEDYAGANAIPFPSPQAAEARLFSGSMYLAHSTSDEKFSEICEAGLLLSAKQLAALGKETLKPDSAKVLLGTTGSVFFYLAPFRYPNTGCGMLFARSLEERHKDDGVATPFDSGGLLRNFTRPDTTEPLPEFLSHHELPIPDHREYLGRSLGVLFEKPADYMEGLAPRWPGPIGLTGGDHRRWTHEVRIPDQVLVRSGHLEAVFAPMIRVAADAGLEKLFKWCEREGVDAVAFEATRRNDFEALRRECIAYVRRKLG